MKKPNQRNRKPKTPLQAYGSSDVGQKREANEDSYLDLPLMQHRKQKDNNSWLPSTQAVQQKGRMWVVADGMGGHVGGKEASGIVVNEMMQSFYQYQSPDTMKSLQYAVSNANSAVYNYASEHPELKGMGSTLVAAVLKEDILYVCWVGDSRGYILRNGKLSPLTKDHSWIQVAIDSGTVTEEEAKTHPNRSVILRSMGAKKEVKADFLTSKVRPGDIYLLCSDGLSGVVDDPLISKIIQTSPTEKDAVKGLIEQANKNGGPDNITAAIISMGGFKGKGAAVPPPQAKANKVLLAGIVGLVLLFGIVLTFLFFYLSLPKGGQVRGVNNKPTAIISTTVIVLTATTTITPTLPTEIKDNETPDNTTTTIPTVTLIPPTAIPSLTPIPVETPTPIIVIPTTSPIPTTPPTPGIHKPMLLNPKNKDVVFTGKKFPFRWNWSGQLPANHGFEIRIWLEEKTHLGAFNAKESQQFITNDGNGNYEYSFDPESAASVQKNGSKATYNWTVAVVQLEPYKRVGQEAEPRIISIQIPTTDGPGGDGGPGGGDDGPAVGGPREVGRKNEN